MTPPDTTSRRAWLVWAAGVAAYLIAVFDRTSLAVAGVEAADRFGVSAAILSTFAVVQLLVYAGMQVPVGVLLDRYGSRRLLVAGALLMAAGQLALAVADSFSAAIAARVLVGTGDAMTFISVLRLVSAWFPARRTPLVTQFTGQVGQFGQILSAVPLAAVLAGPGWTTAFAGSAAVGLLVALLVALVLRDAPPGTPSWRRALTAGEIRAELGRAWREPGTRLGMWTHFTSQYAGVVFAMLWGFPFLTRAQGLSGRAAGVLLTVLVVGGMLAGPLLGRLTARHPLRRSWIVLGVVSLTVLAWTAVLLWPGRAPLPLLVGLMLALGLNGPTSAVGFDYARTFNPPTRLGSATGIVNVGGFVASLVTIFLVGLVLDLRGGGTSTYSLADFKVAFAVQYILWGIGVVGILRTRRLARRQLAAQGVEILSVREALRRRRTRALNDPAMSRR